MHALPPTVRRWNWGAFLLSWIWAIGNQVWIGVLAVLPMMTPVMMFVLGVKGNEWAWEKRRWRSVEEFHAHQQKWAVAGLVVWAGMIALAVFAPSVLS